MVHLRVLHRPLLFALVTLLPVLIATGCAPERGQSVRPAQLLELESAAPWRSFKLYGVVTGPVTTTPDGLEFRIAQSLDDTATNVQVLYDGSITEHIKQISGRDVIVTGTWDGIFRTDHMIIRTSNGPYYTAPDDPDD